MSGVDVCVVGAGPAGLVLATELATRGMAVEVVAPEATWIPGYGCWAEDIERLLEPHLASRLQSAVHHTWSFASIHTDRLHHRIDRAYTRFDTPALQEVMDSAAREAGVRRVAGRVSALGAPETERQSIFGTFGQRHARLVVDASGRGLPETRALQPPGLGPGHQVAFGQRITVETHPWQPGELVLMDWRRLRDPSPHCGDPERLPTFLYALPFSDTEVFVEETVLSGRPQPRLEHCESRLQARLKQLDIVPIKVLETERCVIEMGTRLPDLSRSTRALLPFGAAGGLVHPATGYSLLQSLRLAPAIAATIADGLSTSTGRETAQSAWDTLWPLEARRNRALYQYGLELLLDLPLHATQRFYEAFFRAEADLPAQESLWHAYMSDRGPPAEVARLMTRVFRAADGPTRPRLAWGGQGSSHLDLLRALIGL